MRTAERNMGVLLRRKELELRNFAQGDIECGPHLSHCPHSKDLLYAERRPRREDLGVWDCHLL